MKNISYLFCVLCVLCALLVLLACRRQYEGKVQLGPCKAEQVFLEVRTDDGRRINSGYGYRVYEDGRWYIYGLPRGSYDIYFRCRVSVPDSYQVGEPVSVVSTGQRIVPKNTKPIHESR